MASASHGAMLQDLEEEYRLRFARMAGYRDRVWKVLTGQFFQAYVPRDGAVLDLGCGWGEFINNIEARTKYAHGPEPRIRASAVAERQLPEAGLLHHVAGPGFQPGCGVHQQLLRTPADQGVAARNTPAGPPMPQAGRHSDLPRAQHQVPARVPTGTSGITFFR